MSNCLLIAVISLVAIQIGPTARQDPADTMDDAAVYDAVIEHTLRDRFRMSFLIALKFTARLPGLSSANGDLVDVHPDTTPDVG